MNNLNTETEAEKMLLTRDDTRTLVLSSFGGALEFYDFVIYVFYAKVLSELFFPAGLNPFWAMLNTYGIFAAGYLFRPLGGIVMAHFGDLLGRKKLFALSIMMMALPDFVSGADAYFCDHRLCSTYVVINLKNDTGCGHWW